jgi:hypothetical protein
MPPFRSLEGIPRNPNPRHPFCQSFCWPRSPSVSPDGSCGGADGYICLESEFGDCCSAYGYCGSFTGHCTAGCLSAFGTCEEVSTRFHPTALVVEGTGTCALEVGLAIAALHTDTAVLRADSVPRDVRGRLGRANLILSCIYPQGLAPYIPLPLLRLQSHLHSYLAHTSTLTSALTSAFTSLSLPLSSPPHPHSCSRALLPLFLRSSVASPPLSPFLSPPL